MRESDSVEPNVLNRTLFVENDNLDVMRGLNSGCIDLIYLDPPFNSNKTYAAPIGDGQGGQVMASFKDSWTMDDVKVEWVGMIADQYPALSAIIFASGKTAGTDTQAYLTMMAVRLLEMRRLLKPSGSIYLHCDPTMSHYLKLVMDAVFGQRNFQNEIAWRKYGGYKNTAKRKFTTETDTLLFYSRGDRHAFSPVYRPLSPTVISGEYKHVDEDGRRYAIPRGRQYRKGIVKRVYLDEHPGVAVGSLWSEKELTMQGRDNERTGYPTQKPLALLERIIQASSQPGDVVLDPFCGCATACVAAERLGRRWIGIDLSPLAVNLIKQRFWGTTANPLQAPFSETNLMVRHDVPMQTVDLAPAPIDWRHVQYGKQEGKCLGCEHHFPFQNMTKDHDVPTAKGGQDTPTNWQLLCGRCNSVKGATLDLAALRAKNKRDGYMAA